MNRVGDSDPATTAAAVSLCVQVGDAIQKERQRRGLSQSQLAKLVELSLKYIGEIERGEANLTLETLERITKALDLNLFEVAGHTRNAVLVSVRAEAVRTEAARAMLAGSLHHVVASLSHTLQTVQTAIGWLAKLDTELAQEQQAAQVPDESPPIRRRGRPRTQRPSDSSIGAGDHHE